MSGILHTAYEAMARPYAVAKDYKPARMYIAKASRQLGSLSVDDEDRKVYLNQIRETNGLIGP